MEKLGIENLKPYVMLAVELANVADKVGRAKGAAGRLAPLMELTDEVFALGNSSYKQALAEFKDLDTTEKAMLMEEVKRKFDLVDDVLEIVIEEGLLLLADAADVVQRGIALGAKLKKA